MTQTAGARNEWKAGWTVVLASGFGFVVSGIHLYSIGLFLEPLEREFGWARSAITGAMMIPSVFAFFLSPLFGHFVDRWGARRIGLAGATSYCVAFALFGLTGAQIWNWWLLWVLLALCLVLVKPTVWSAALSSRFAIGRGFALAVALCGTGVGSLVTPLAANFLIDRFGWRLAFARLGLGWAAIILPILLLFFFDARDIGRRTATASPAPGVLAGLTVRQGLRSRSFYTLALVALIATTMIVGTVVHLVPMLSGTGIARATAAGIAGTLGITSIIGRLSVGLLLDRTKGPQVAAISLALPAVSALLLLLAPGSVPVAIAAAAVLGLSIGAELDSVIYLATRYFGLRNYGALFGFIAALISIGTGLGPLTGSALFDHFGSYQPFLLTIYTGRAAVQPAHSDDGRLSRAPARKLTQCRSMTRRCPIKARSLEHDGPEPSAMHRHAQIASAQLVQSRQFVDRPRCPMLAGRLRRQEMMPAGTSPRSGVSSRHRTEPTGRSSRRVMRSSPPPP
jgi:MFS family permease